jgi:putative membrane protein
VRLLLSLVVNVLAVGFATWLLDGITLDGGSDSDQLVRLVVVGAIFGLVNWIVRPLVRFVALPFIVLTLGLLLIVINALMLMLTSSIAGALDLGWHVDGFWTAVLGSIVISVAAMVLDLVLPDPDRR